MNARIPIYIMQYHNLCGKGRGCDKRVHFVIDNVGPEPHRHAYVVCIGRTICAVTPPSDDRFERVSLCVCVCVQFTHAHTTAQTVCRPHCATQPKHTYRSTYTVQYGRALVEFCSTVCLFTYN